MSILKVARMGHPVLRKRARALERADLKSAVVQQPHRRHDRHDGGVSRHRPRGARRCTRASASSSPACRKTQRATTTSPAIVPVPFINPEIVPIGNEKETDWEGCLSIPDIRGKVPRYTRVKIRGLDREGTRQELQLTDFRRARGAARKRSPRRRPVLRPDEAARDADIPRRIREVLAGLVGPTRAWPFDVELRHRGTPRSPSGTRPCTRSTARLPPRARATRRGSSPPRSHRPAARHDRRAHLRGRAPHGLPARALRVRAREHLAPVRLDGAARLSFLQLRAVQPALRQAEGAACVRPAASPAKRCEVYERAVLSAWDAYAELSALLKDDAFGDPEGAAIRHAARERGAAEGASSAKPRRRRSRRRATSSRSARSPRWCTRSPGITLHRLRRMAAAGDTPHEARARDRPDGGSRSARSTRSSSRRSAARNCRPAMLPEAAFPRPRGGGDAFAREFDARLERPRARSWSTLRSRRAMVADAVRADLRPHGGGAARRRGARSRAEPGTKPIPPRRDERVVPLADDAGAAPRVLHVRQAPEPHG